jgi:hypothetical protein
MPHHDFISVKAGFLSIEFWQNMPALVYTMILEREFFLIIVCGLVCQTDAEDFILSASLLGLNCLILAK